MKYEVLNNGKRVVVEIENLKFETIVSCTIDKRKFNLAFAGSKSFETKVGGSELLELAGVKLGEEEYYIIDYSYKLKKDIAILTKGEWFKELL